MTMKRDNRPVEEQSKAFGLAYDHFNDALFGGTLPPCMLELTRNKNVIAGFFSPHAWEQDGEKYHTIALNANLFSTHGITELMASLVHEMAHLEQFEKGTASRAGYHNTAFIKRMDALGFDCFNAKTGEKVGKGCQSLTDKYREAGPFMDAFLALPDAAIFPYETAGIINPDGDGGGQGGGGQAPTPKPKGSAGGRSKYTCPVCGLNAWAKPGVALTCGEHGVEMISAD